MEEGKQGEANEQIGRQMSGTRKTLKINRICEVSRLSKISRI